MTSVADALQAAGSAPTSQHRPPVTVIGLGMMGVALADAFLRAGHPTTVWNRSAGKADDLVDRGARRAASIADAVSASGLVVICVSDYDAVREVLAATGVSGALAGRVVANLTSGTPEQARATAAWVAERGAAYLDGAIMTIPPGIGQADTLLLYSGSSDAFEAHRTTLALLGGRTTYLGADPGLAALFDMGLLSMMYALYGGALHALALVGTAGVSGAAFMPYATAWLDGVVSWLPDLAREVDERDFATDISTLDINRAGIAHIVHTSEALGISPDVLRPIQALVERRVAAGHGADGLASLIEEVRRPAVA